MSDSLDSAIGHNASDPGSIDGLGLEKQQNGLASAAGTKKNAKAGKNQNRQNSQHSSNAVDEKPKYSWSEHVWSKSISSQINVSGFHPSNYFLIQ